MLAPAGTDPELVELAETTETVATRVRSRSSRRWARWAGRAPGLSADHAVERRFEGPARVRGSAGTGKTVVAFHRAATLAARRRDGDRRPILFTTCVKSLPPVFATLYLRLPGTRAGEVEFVNVDKLAFAVCRSAGERPVVVPEKVDAAYSAAHAAVVRPGCALARAGLTRAYLREEVTAVIKGRGLATVDEYLDVERVGRRTRLTEPLRREVWHLHEVWARQMERAGVVDFADVVLHARDHARRRREAWCPAAIIDAALAVGGAEVVDDLGDSMTRDGGAAGIEADRMGMKPILVTAAGFDDQLRFLAQQIERLVESGAIGTGDIAVAVATNEKAMRIERFLSGAGLPVQRLTAYEGTPTDGIKVGTHFRIKGLEFKVVFLPGLGADEFPRAQAKGQDPAEYEEQRARAVGQLYVAMTRARDGLFVLCSGEPSPVLAPALERFELLET